MKFIIFFNLLICSIVIINTSLYSEHTEKITIENFIEKSVKVNYKFQEILSDKLSLAYKKDISLPLKDLIINLNGNYNLCLNRIDDSYPDITFSLSKLFPNSGTSISGQYNYGINKTGNSQVSSLIFLISQPLLENSFGYSTRIKDKLIGLEIDIAKYQILEAYENYYSFIIELYYDWYSSFINLKLRELDCKESGKLLKDIQKRYSKGVAEETDVYKLKLQKSGKMDNLTAASNVYISYRNKAGESILLADHENIIPVEPDLYKKRDIQFNNAYTDFTNSSRTYKIMKLLKQRNLYDLKILKNNKLPSLNLDTGFKMEGSGADFKDNRNYIFAGLSLGFPVTGKREHAEYEIAKIEYDKLLLSLKGDSINYFTILKNLYNEIEREKTFIKNAENKIQIADKILELERKNYQNGRIPLNDLITAMNNYEEIKFNKIIHEINFYKLNIRWLKITDNLIIKDASAIHSK